MTPSFDVVIPTIGRPSLVRVLAALAVGDGPAPGTIFVVDDRREGHGPPLDLPISRVVVLRGRAAGPAAARNVGWRASSAEWIAFLDDDVEPEDDWRAQLAIDLAEAGDDVGGVQGHIDVPVPEGRRPTDWERNVQGLMTARWPTADMAYRRAALEEVGGFDERFPRAYREDADLALRVQRAGWRLVMGRRGVVHPARPEDRWVSVRVQRGNADDALMRALHGRRWREEAGIPAGRRRRHLAIVIAATFAAGALALGRRRTAATLGLAALSGALEFAWARIAPGPRTPREIATMLATSAAIPFAATYHFLRGWTAVPGLLAKGPPRAATPARPAGAHAGPLSAFARPVTFVPDTVSAHPLTSPPRDRPRPRAVLLDRDGTLVHDVPYNGDPLRVAPVSGAREALDRLRGAGIALAVVSNQSGVARGLLSEAQVTAVNARVEELLGPIGPWMCCFHEGEDRCACRKPAPGLVVRAASALGVPPSECALIGDTGADVGAAIAAGARPVLVPNAATLEAEIARAPEVAPDLGAAVDLLLGGRA